jgi:hypothetical protein
LFLAAQEKPDVLCRGSLGIQLLLCACIPTPVIKEFKDQALLF